MKTRRIAINGLKHQVYLWGQPKNPPLFLFHGWLDTGAGFHFLSDYLQDQFYCIAPDLRGYGKSEHSPSPLGYFFFEYVADVHQLLKKFSPRRPVSMLGHSLGGAILSVYAGTFPKRVKNFINVEGFGFQRQDLQRPFVRAQRWLDGLNKQEFPIHRDLSSLATRLQKNYPRLNRKRALFLAKWMAKKTRGGYQIAADPNHKNLEPYPFPIENFFAFWKNTSARSLFVSAGETELAQYYDRGTYQREMDRRRRCFPSGCKTVQIPAVGHMIHHEKPEELAAIVREFLIP